MHEVPVGCIMICKNMYKNTAGWGGARARVYVRPEVASFSSCQPLGRGAGGASLSVFAGSITVSFFVSAAVQAAWEVPETTAEGGSAVVSCK